MQQIAEWLEELGMSEYAERFADNDVDFSVLPRLSDHDLKELGEFNSTEGRTARRCRGKPDSSHQ